MKPLLTTLALALVLAGCADTAADPGDDGPVTFDSPSPSASESATAPAATGGQVLPLTGAATDDSKLVERPAVAVVLRYAGGGTPAGLDAADIVYQEPALNGGSRLVALYHSKDAPKVGPVGTTQPSDIRLLGVLKPIYAYGGGAERFTKQLPGKGLATVQTSGYANTASLRTTAPKGAGRALQLLPYAEVGQPFTAAKARTVATVTVTVPGQSPQVWKRSAAGWTQTGAGGPKVTVTNLVMPVSKYRNVRSDKSGAMVADPGVQGKGAMTAVSGDKLVGGTWNWPMPTTAGNYLDSSNTPLRLLPGRTWVLLAPPGTTVAGS